MSALPHLLVRVRRAVSRALMRAHVRQLSAAIGHAEAEGHGWHADVVRLRNQRARVLAILNTPETAAEAAARLERDHPMHWGI